MKRVSEISTGRKVFAVFLLLVIIASAFGVFNYREKLFTQRVVYSDGCVEEYYFGENINNVTCYVYDASKSAEENKQNYMMKTLPTLSSVNLSNNE